MRDVISGEEKTRLKELGGVRSNGCQMEGEDPT